MDIAGELRAIPILGRILKYPLDWYKGPTIEVTTSRAFALYDSLKGQPYKLVDFQIRVENIGTKTVYDLRASVYFHAIISPDDPRGTVTVDTRGTWEQNEHTSISLRGGESEWLNVLRVVQDYSQGRNFDVDTDVYMIFPTDRGWTQPSRIRTRWLGSPSQTSLTSDKLTREEAKELVWEEARIEIIGENGSGSEVSLVYDVDLPDLRNKMDNRGGFFKGPANADDYDSE